MDEMLQLILMQDMAGVKEQTVLRFVFELKSTIRTAICSTL